MYKLTCYDIDGFYEWSLHFREMENAQKYAAKHAWRDSLEWQSDLFGPSFTSKDVERDRIYVIAPITFCEDSQNA